MFTEILGRVAVVIVFLLPISVVALVGRDRLSALRREWRDRLRVSWPIVTVLIAVLLLNRVMRWSARRITDRVGIHMTETFYGLEGEFILVFQSLEAPAVTTYFTLIYVYGYTFMLLFPVVAYFALSDTRPFRRLLAAYALNYAIGLVFYLVVIALGPRNVMPDVLGQTMLYDTSPEYQHLTREVNRATNVFPSLHTSLSATVAVFAYWTRDEYPRWAPVAVVLALSVWISTMYLGLHWAIDVLAGLVLAGVCVGLSQLLVGRWSVTDALERLDR
ncbi:phosphatase PAP2 family protein [Halobiforma nitratireducens]|uniref:PA-phosphatase-like phosphoesterase n=1 Tax=Halobiforma nitratireducens JCM 10879 TaxID=1227454 RepID=M0LLX6_9EURY|nr:phosphatase PAP2 family protein [Halobiforma nitratireducens]EMA34103.1 PA-phosphatase-like phosphoesterase [Halobiforma nitratireducens JCM 10879]